MTKKLKLCIIITLIIQITVPSYLLINHYTVNKKALESEKEYFFLLSDIDFITPNTEYVSECECFYFYIAGANKLYDRKIAVTQNEDGLAVLSEKNRITDTWFYYKHYYKNRSFFSDSFTFESGVDINTVIRDTREAYNHRPYHFNSDKTIGNNTETRKAYISAKVYKGLFIPTAVYFGAEKIITINSVQN